MLVLLALSPALALDCIEWDVQRLMPEAGATDIPVNAQVTFQLYSWYPVNEQPDPVLFDTTGEVKATVSAHDAGTDVTYVITPDTLLDPSTSYTVHLQHPYTDGPPLEVTTFTTGTHEDTTAPPAPNVAGLSSNLDTDEWGDWYTFLVETEAVVDDSPVKYELEIEDTSSGSTWTRWQLEAAQPLADNPCSDDEAALTEAGDAVVTVRAIDIAGNASDEVQIGPEGDTDTDTDTDSDTDTDTDTDTDSDTDTDTDTDPGKVGGGCSVAPVAPAGLSVLLPLLAVFWRRRRTPLEP